jgi:hypothetical protein
MKKLVFKYFDTFCYKELIVNDEYSNWFTPDIDQDAFGYGIDSCYLFYNEGLQSIILSTFGVGRTEFKEYLGEWFEKRYNLPVSLVL